jgi:hypothetical protein
VELLTDLHNVPKPVKKQLTWDQQLVEGWSRFSSHPKGFALALLDQLKESLAKAPSASSVLWSCMGVVSMCC